MIRTKFGKPLSLILTLCMVMTFLCIPSPSYAQVEYNLYFGNFHAHTSYSDGQGTPEQAFKHMKESGAGDFGAITDHNYSLTSSEWTTTKQAADKYTDSSFVGIAGVEMELSDGNEMCTFNVDEFVTYSLENYYDWLAARPASVAQYNHPGYTGDFSNFNYRTETRDKNVCLLEYGNTGYSTTYFNSYVKALDKGWCVAPAANSDTHDNDWLTGTENRTVVLAPSLTRENIFEAVRAGRVYATEDKNLRLSFLINGQVMGSTLYNPSTLDISVTATDPDSSERITKAELFADGGVAVSSKTNSSNSLTWTLQLSPQKKYYFIKLTESDGDTVVSAPIWISSSGGTVPAVPAGLTATASGPSQINVSWSASQGATGYDLEVDGTTLSNITSPYAHTGLTAGSTHSYRVRAKNSSGTSAWSTTVNATTTGSTSPNLALNKAATALSVEGSGFEAGKAFDGSATTRWASVEYVDPQWIYVDLSTSYNIGSVKLTWEDAYAKSYRIEVSPDKTNWTTVYSTTSGNGATDDISFSSVSGRYVRMYGTQRGTAYGYSLYEFEVYEGAAPQVPAVPTGLAASAASSSQINVSWSSVSGATGYDLEVDGTVISDITSPYAHTGLAAGSTHGYRVRAKNSAGTSPWSTSANATTTSNTSSNLALNKTATALSIEGSGFEAGKAFDGSATTRWASVEYVDPQWIYVDLGTSYNIGRVKLTWEAAHAKSYRIEISADSTNWTTVSSTTSGDGGTDDITFNSTSGRYVRMYGTQRGTSYGYSLYEFEVYE